MGTPTLDRARAYADTLTAAGVPTFVDPAQAAANVPCALVVPPALTFDRLDDQAPASVEWRLVVLAQRPAGLDAWAQLDDVLHQLVAAGLDAQRAEPGSYTLTGGTDPYPCYIVTTATE